MTRHATVWAPVLNVPTAVEMAKGVLRDEGWTIVTVVRVARADRDRPGWDVTLAVKATGARP